MLYQLQRLINHINLTTASVGMKKLVASWKYVPFICMEEKKKTVKASLRAVDINSDPACYMLDAAACGASSTRSKFLSLRAVTFLCELGYTHITHVSTEPMSRRLFSPNVNTNSCWYFLHSFAQAAERNVFRASNRCRVITPLRVATAFSCS
jgi:hypothetical protein